MLHYFPSHQSSEAKQHIKKALLFHRPTYKWVWFCPEFWNVSFFFLRAKLECDGHRMPLLWDNKSCHVRAWRHLSFLSWPALPRCRASSAPGTATLSLPILLGCPCVLQKIHLICCKQHPIRCLTEPPQITLVPCAIYSGTGLVLPLVGLGWLAKKKKKERALCACDLSRY